MRSSTNSLLVSLNLCRSTISELRLSERRLAAAAGLGSSSSSASSSSSSSLLFRSRAAWWRCERPRDACRRAEEPNEAPGGTSVKLPPAKEQADEEEQQRDEPEELLEELEPLWAGKSPLSFEYLSRLFLKSLFEFTNTKSLLGSKTRVAFMMFGWL